MNKRYKPDYSFVYISKWKITGFDDYYFTTNKRLFNSKTNRFSKKVVRNYSIGYNLNGKFYTLKRLKPLINKIDKLSLNNNYINI